MTETLDINPDTYPTDFSVLNQGQFLSVFKNCVDDIDKVNAFLKRLSGIKRSLQQEAISRCNSEDISKLAGDGITITVKEMPVVKLDPETDWSSVLTKLCDDGYAHMVQRRLSAAKLREESDSGYRLPDGVTIEEIQVANHRRSS
tara:strand:+ start:309 stop:743 length:435 start_codon:yes stop_codon:yes gene_type:complete